MKKLISPSLSPNVELKDIVNALKSILSVFHWKKGENISKVESWFRYTFNSKYAICFSQGREAEYALLVSFGVRMGDEVIVQAFTCSAVVSPILWLGAKPIFVDIESSTYSIDTKDLKKKISDKTKVIIAQHTFGIPAQIEEIKKIASDHKLFLIEDCAHVINGFNRERKLGTFGDAAFFSFGRDKAISSVFGGIAITNKKKIGENVKKIRERSPYPSYIWIIQQLMHPLLTFLVIQIYTLNPFISKLLLFIFKKINAISRPFTQMESDLYSQHLRTRSYPNALATLSMDQLLRVSNFNKKREIIFETYKEELKGYNIKLPTLTTCYLRVPVLVANQLEAMEFFKKQSIYLGDWYSHVIDPYWIKLEDFGYRKGSCRMAENYASKIINLPSYPTMTISDTYRVIETLKKYYSQKS